MTIEVPSGYRRNGDAWRAGWRHDRTACPPEPGPDRVAYQAGWTAAAGGTPPWVKRAQAGTLPAKEYGR